MEPIEDFKFVSHSGLAASARLGIDVDPYARAENGLARQVWDEGISGARWFYRAKQIDVKFDRTIVAYPSPDLHHVVVVCYGSNQYPPPHNALVLNADGSMRHQVRQPMQYAGRKTEFLDAWWYYREIPQPPPPWWAFWRKPAPPMREVRIKMLIGGDIGLPNLDFVALDFDPSTGECGEVVDSGRL